MQSTFTNCVSVGIGTQMYIGHTTPIHLLSVNFLVILYLLEIVLSYPFLETNN
ncbi:hypothetical protein [Heyndrickxia oleronia]|uniref:hypothetical protein n=1 Tax=Heyndrickxia oleronia TaxID=38875 RepID=UPI001C0EAB03|nr:hypothetical protein [Heyndrickxia oleronia]MBU5213896.1 hypothetical protein [Heyndrickxia oleronia]